MHWPEVLEAYEEAPDADNRRYVYESYKGMFGVKRGPPNLKGMWRMLKAEEHPDLLQKFINGVFRLDPARCKEWIANNRERYQEIIDKWKNTKGWSFYGNDLEKQLNTLEKIEPDLWRFWNS